MKAGTECWRNTKMPENEIRRIIKEEMYNFIEDAYTKLKNYSIFSDFFGDKILCFLTVIIVPHLDMEECFLHEIFLQNA